MSGLVEHAQRELQLVGEDEQTTEGILKVVKAFSDMGHSGTSAMICREMLYRLLGYEPLSLLTDGQDEWYLIDKQMLPEGSDELWQSTRDPKAFSQDGGKSYYLVDEYVAAGHDLGTTPIYRTASRSANGQASTG